MRLGTGLALGTTVAIGSLGAVLAGCGDGTTTSGGTDKGRVVLYCSLDEPFSKFVKEDFKKKTGIELVFNTDTEVDKSVGLRQKILSEKANPQCDVFWNNEPANTETLRQAGVLAPYKSDAAKGIPEQYMDPDGYWTGFAARARVLIINTDLVKPEDEPTSMDDIFDPKWKGKACIAIPIAGTTATHAAALYAAWGEEKARAYFQKIKDAGVIITDGNAHVKNMVASGECAIGWTDTDDVHVGIRAGKPVKVIYPDQGTDQAGTLVLPNTVMLIKGGPNPENGKKLIDYLLSHEIEPRATRCRCRSTPA
ncbi:MAG: extracellular solute-binding protein [Planctomycetota bacterium]|jgi:iron(III) transport system substrate-binding protein